MMFTGHISIQSSRIRSKLQKNKFDAALKEAGIAEDPGTVVDQKQADALVQSLIKQQWAMAGCTATGSDIWEEGSKLFEVKAAAIEKISDSSAYEGKILVRMSRFFTCVFTVFMGFLAILLNQLGLGLGWVYQAMGNIIGSAVCPVAMAILYQKANGPICTFAALFGFVLAMIAWVWKTANDSECLDANEALCASEGITTAAGLAACKAEATCGVTIDNMGALYPNLVGNIVAICSSGFIALVGSLVKPDNTFEWETLSGPDGIDVVDDVIPELKEDEQPEQLEKDAKRANIQAIILTILLVVIWPLPQHISQGVFTVTGFGVWIGGAFIWALLAALVIIIMPPVEFILKGKSNAGKSP